VSLAQRFERRLEGLVGGAFARVFKGQVEPVEIGAALQREAADKRNVMGNGQILAPNRYRVTLSSSDHERLIPWDVQLTSSLAELVQEYLDENRWSTIGDIEVYLACDDQLHTGVFGVASRMEPKAPPRRRPHDSMSLPSVPGAPVGQYANQYSPGPSAYASPSPSPYSPAPVAPAPMPAPVPVPQPVSQPAASFPAPAQPAPQYQPVAPASPSSPPGVPGIRRPPSVVVDQTNQRFELRVGSNVVGRGTDADLQLLDQGISRRHLDIQYDGNFATAYDLGSTNGTSVNGHEVGSQMLRHGDVLRVGHTRLVFHQDQV
jgi:FhaA, N-terminal domain/FHA domain